MATKKRYELSVDLNGKTETMQSNSLVRLRKIADVLSKHFYVTIFDFSIVDDDITVYSNY